MKVRHHHLTKAFSKVKRDGWYRSRQGSSTVVDWYKSYRTSQRLTQTKIYEHDRYLRTLALLEDKITQMIPNPLEPIKLDQCKDTFRDLSASAGFCFFGKYKNKRDIPDVELHQCEKVLRSGAANQLPKYRIAFRSHISKGIPKMRVILVAPGPLSIYEKRFAYPIQQAILAAPHPRVFMTGFDWFKSGGIEIADFQTENTVSIDYKAFDQSLPTYLMRDLFRILKRRFQLSTRDAGIFDTMVDSYARSIADHNGKEYVLTGGVRTGSSWTHILGCAASAFDVLYRFGDVDFRCYGDDVILKTNISAKKMAHIRKKESPYTISPEKTFRGVYWLGLVKRKNKWVLPDRTKRWAQYFYPEHKPTVYDPHTRLQALLLNCGADPIREQILEVLRDTNGMTMTKYLPDMMRTDVLHNPDLIGVNIQQIEAVLKRNMSL